MIWKLNGGQRCPKCGGRMLYYSESEGYDSSKVVRYIIRCKSCGFREVLQEVEIKKVQRGLLIVRRY